ncbi:MAG: ABC transporter permease, partial [Bacteroidales bacterium]
MKFPLFISKRYLIAKKSRNAINIISMISIVGVTIGVASLIVVLSVFNGFDEVIKSMYNAFDPDLKITPATGKVFTLNDSLKTKIIHHPNVLD